MNKLSIIRRAERALTAVVCICALASFFTYPSAFAAEEIAGNTVVSIVSVAAGDSLPISVKLIPFGPIRRVDAGITYKIFSADGALIYIEQEQASINTNASFIRQVGIPANTKPGKYRIESDVTFANQARPAVSSFYFNVELKAFGISKENILVGPAIAFLEPTSEVITITSATNPGSQTSPAIGEIPSNSTTSLIVQNPLLSNAGENEQLILFDVLLNPVLDTDVDRRVAAGESLPISVKLTNFGSTRRADVQITYRIVNAENIIIYSEHETIAVDTSASFVKQIQIPSDTPSGTYRAESEIQYPFQESPASGSFEFKVERKLFGIFQSDLLLFGSLALLLSILTFMASRVFMRARAGREPLHSYADKPQKERIYYEMVSDTISQMRRHAGDDALEIACDIPGLKIEKETGKVLTLLGDPADIMASLVAHYESRLGKRVSLVLRKSK
ncbi:MAG: hypothetical protein ABI430_00345 [Candidatus Taylorbacteria bacterium]